MLGPLLALALAAAAPPQAPRPRGDVLPFRAVESTLPNGLRVIVVPTGPERGAARGAEPGGPGLVSLQIAIQAGSRNEVEPGRSGFAHLFEHLMFRGTRRYPAE